MKPIETPYAGYRFRSRLEARWAVFFNHMGIKWDYEPEGYMVGPHEEQAPYLPDFWLPDLKQWVEVKGTHPSKHDRLRIIHACVTHSGWGLPNNDQGVLLLGGIPEPQRGVQAWHPVFTFYKGDIYRSPFEWGKGCIWEREWLIYSCVDACSFDIYGYAGSSSWSEASTWNPTAWLMDGFGLSTIGYNEGYRAARSARFEHGEAG